MTYDHLKCRYMMNCETSHALCNDWKILSTDQVTDVSVSGLALMQVQNGDTLYVKKMKIVISQ